MVDLDSPGRRPGDHTGQQQSPGHDQRQTVTDAPHQNVLPEGRIASTAGLRQPHPLPGQRRRHSKPLTVITYPATATVKRSERPSALSWQETLLHGTTLRGSQVRLILPPEAARAEGTPRTRPCR